MKVLKTVILFVVFMGLHIQTAFTQNISREDKRTIKSKEQEIRVNEEILLSGVEGLERIKSRLAKDKQKGRASKEEIARKENIILNVERRLSKLDQKIIGQKKELKEFKASVYGVKEEVQSSESIKEVVKVARIEKRNADDLMKREEELEQARQKLEQEIQESKEAYNKQLEALRIKNEKLAQLDNKLKAEQQAIDDKISEEKRIKMMEYEDDISVNEEMLTSGREGVQKKKTELETAKKEGKLTEEDIARKESIINRIEKRLNTLESEIKSKKEELQKLKES
ncbi:coiled-coil domain-containing protein [Tenacibaculum agarivorans]|uniref:hypothetical protein n=1 Tax=Tenacibaculum agarivorans TaxID=1908389 RepID=UPI000A86C184|nr:hypothetical protein [Tenacibaculum agarivorans]